MRPRVFLSYAAQDASEIAERVEQALDRRGAVVYRFQNADHSGRQFMRDIPREIEDADVFVALMSPGAETSELCQRERELAVYLSQRRDDQFIYVFKVGAVAPSGWLATQDWIDLTALDDDKALEAAIDALPLPRSPLPEVIEPGPQNRFRNRNDELRHINDALTTSGDTDFWAVISGPKLGKSWFLQKVRENFEEATGGWTRLVDLRDHEFDVRYSAARVFCLLLDVAAPTGELSDTEMVRIVGIVAKRNKAQLSLLDSAELMDRETAAELRVLLDDLHKRVSKTPYRSKTRLSVIVGTRRGDEWAGSRVSGTNVRRFKPVSLTEFGTSVVRQALMDTGLTFESADLAQWTDALYRMTAGLPALIMTALDWADASGYANLEASDSDTTFDTVVKPYIEKDLLSMATLLPEGGDRPSHRHKAMLAAIRVIAPYRIVTRSHLKYHLEHDEQFEADLAEAGWVNDELWAAIEKSALTTKGQNLWLSQYPAIRQLLYRYFYRDDTVRRATHDGALAFYKHYWGDGSPAGMEQGYILVESIWHAAMTMCCGDTANICESLPELAVELTERFMRPERYEPSEWRDFVHRRLIEDEELLRLTEPYEGLFDRVLSRVCDTIAGGD